MWFWLANNSFKPASIKYISKVVCPKYLRGFYKYLLCLKKSSGELLWSAHYIWHQMPSPVTRMQQPVESSCPDGELVQMQTRHLWAQGGVLGTKRLSYSGCQEGGGGESLSQHKLLSLNSWQDTRHFSKRKFIIMNKTGWERGLRSESWRPCHVSSALFSRVLKD